MVIDTGGAIVAYSLVIEMGHLISLHILSAWSDFEIVCACIPQLKHEHKGVCEIESSHRLADCSAHAVSFYLKLRFAGCRLQLQPGEAVQAQR